MGTGIPLSASELISVVKGAIYMSQFSHLENISLNYLSLLFVISSY